MLAIKLQRIGKKHQPSYRIVVAEKRSKMLAPPVEDLGAYDAFAKKAQLNMNRISYWLGVGARPTATVHNLLVKEGILNAPKIKIKMKMKAAPAEAAVAKEAAAEAPAATPEAQPEAAA